MNRNMLEISVPAIIAGLEEVARTIGQIITDEYKRRPVEKDLDRLYSNIKFYYKKALELRKEEGDAVKLAKDIEKDVLFSIYATNERTEKIVNALIAIAALSDKRSISRLERKYGRKYTRAQARHYCAQARHHRAQARRQIVHWVLKCLKVAKNITIKK